MTKPLPVLVLLLISILTNFNIPENKIFPRSISRNLSEQKAIISCFPQQLSNNSPDEISINDNRKIAGTLKGDVLNLELEARAGAWYPESHEGRSIKVYAFAEKGKAMQLPGPLIRVKEGTMIRASIHNMISEAPLVLHGFYSRPNQKADSLIVPFGKTIQTEFRAGVAGTYFYKATVCKLKNRNGEAFFSDSQLFGAFIVDPADRPVDSLERIFVIGLYNDTLNGRLTTDREQKCINGLSWPFTEQLNYEVNEQVNWRIINASNQEHPMHLHGFYYTVKSRGERDRDHILTPTLRYHAVTELLTPGQTMSMTWKPVRAGNWLFHCHTLVHITPDTFLRDGVEMNDHGSMDLASHARNGMGGLIMGIHVLEKAGKQATLQSTTIKERALTLTAVEQYDFFDTLPGMGFILKERNHVYSEEIGIPGPPIVLTRNEPVAITVVNHLPEATTVHWHGLEIESYFDGVSGWGNRGSQLAPLVQPGDSFVVHMTPPRAGTFIYHTHMHSMQLFAGMYGPIIVLEPGEKFHSEWDRVLVMSDGNTKPENIDNCAVLVNGKVRPDTMIFKSGMKYRLRLVNITAFDPLLKVTISQNKKPISWKAIAKDGAQLPVGQMIIVPADLIITVGETRDFEWQPGKPGIYDFRITEEKTEYVKSVIRVI